MSDNPHDTWSSLVVAKRTASAQIEAANVASEAEFRDEFESACQSRRQYDYSRLLGMLNNQYTHIIAFTHAIDDASKLRDDTLSGLFWATAITAIKVSCSLRYNSDPILTLPEAALDADVELVQFIRSLRKLDTAVPNFGADVSRYPSDVRIQEPLQGVFSHYIDCYLKIIEHFTEEEASCRIPNLFPSGPG